MFKRQEKIRLLKPSRRKAPTEYNMQYKKWPTNKSMAEDYKRNSSGKLVPKALLNSPHNLKGRLVNTVTSRGSTKPPNQRHNEQSGQNNKSPNDSNQPTLGETLRASSALLHNRSSSTQLKESPKQHYAGVIENDFSIASTDNKFTPYKIKNTSKGKSGNTQYSRDTREQREFEKKLAEKLDFLTMQSSYHSASNNRLKLTAPTKKDIKFSYPKPHEDTGIPACPLPYKTTLFKPSIKKAWESFDGSRESVKSSAKSSRGQYAEPKCFTEVQPTDNCLGLSHKKPFNVEGLDEQTLKKVYKEATLDDLKLLNETYKDVVTSLETKSENVETTTDIEKITKEQENEMRQKAYRRSRIAYNGPRDNSQWITSYHLDYCLWKPIGMDAEDETPEIMSQAIPTPLPSNDEQTLQSDKTKVLENKQLRRTKSEEERIMSEADSIEKREYNSIFARDGRPKIETSTTSGSSYKVHLCTKPETPVWADKTMVSLGSGHWNLLSHIDDDWKLDTYPGSESLKSIRKRMEEKYKIRVCDPSKRTEAEATEYTPVVIEPCSKVHKNACKTEYMRSFQRLPLPKRKVLI